MGTHRNYLRRIVRNQRIDKTVIVLQQINERHIGLIIPRVDNDVHGYKGR